MGKKGRDDSGSTQLNELLSALAPIELQRDAICQNLRDVPLETKLLSMADVSVELEAENLREVLARLGKL